MSIAQKSQRGTIHPTSEEAGILCPRTPSFLNQMRWVENVTACTVHINVYRIYSQNRCIYFNEGRNIWMNSN